MNEGIKPKEDIFQRRLFAMQDESYRDFQAKIIPNINKETIIGVRAPQLKKLKRELEKLPSRDEFIKELPHQYYEENIIHAWIVASITDYERSLHAVEDFLQYIDNWSVCDTFTPISFKKNLADVEVKIQEWIKSAHPYTVRFGIEMLMKFYLEEHFKPEYLEIVAAVHSEDYYVKMMVAWYFATALAKKYEDTLPYIEEKSLEGWIHNKTIQKAIESFRISNEQKKYLRTLKIK